MNAVIARWLAHPRWSFILAIVVIGLSLPSMWTGWIVDDYVHRAMLLERPGLTAHLFEMFSFVGGEPDRAEALDRIALPWWSAPDLKLSFWRPLSALTHALDYLLWPDAPWLMHLHSVLWYAAVVLVVSSLFRQLLGAGWEAGLAAFIYAVSHAHAMPVFFIANRNALLGVFFGGATLLLHHRWRRLGGRYAAVAAPLCLLLGLLSSEGAIAVCAYLFAYALFLDKGTLRARAMSLTSYAGIVIIWRLGYQLQGYGVAASAAYIDPVASPARFLDAVLTRGPILLLAEWLLPPADFSALVSAATLRAWWCFAVLFLVTLFAVLYPLLRRDRSARFWFTGMLLALIPSCATFPMDRMLLHSGMGGAALLAQFASAALAGELVPTTARVRKIAVRVLFDVLIALHTLCSPLWLPINIVTRAASFRGMTAGIEALAERDDLSRKLVVLLDDVHLSSMYFPAFRALAGRDPVGQLLVLAPVESESDFVILRRTSANTLVVVLDGRYQWFLERDSAHPFAAGDRVDRNRVSVEIQRVTHDGRPTQVAVHFDTPLEDDSIAWFGRIESTAVGAFPTHGRYSPWTPPLVGQTVSVR